MSIVNMFLIFDPYLSALIVWINFIYLQLKKLLNNIGIIICSILLILYSFLNQNSVPTGIPVENNAICSSASDDEENLLIPPDIVIDETEFICKDTSPNNIHTQNSLPEKIPMERDAVFSLTSNNDETLLIPPDIVINDMETILKDSCPENDQTQNSLPAKIPVPVERDVQFSLQVTDNKTQMVPLDTTIDEINFIFDHMVPENVHTQCDKIKKTISRKYLPWLSKYLVNRLSVLPEFHSLLKMCMERFNSKPLNELIYSEAFKRIDASIEQKKEPDYAQLVSFQQDSEPGKIPVDRDSASSPALDVNETLLIPPETVIDELNIIFEHTCLDNVNTQCDKIKKTITRKYLPWLSKYLVNRVCDSYQFHSLLNSCMERLNSKPLNDLIYSETVERINVLIKEENKPESAKAVLSNLGHWLGLITLAKGDPIPYYLEELVDAATDTFFEKQFIIPFVINVLRSCQGIEVSDTTFFEILTTLSYFAELLETSSIIFMYKPEIQLLCKQLNINYEELVFERISK